MSVRKIKRCIDAVNTPRDVEPEAYKKAMDDFLDSDRNTAHQFLHVDSIEQGENGTLIAKITLTPRTVAENITIQKIKDGK